MKKMVIGGVILIVVLMAATFFGAGDAFQSGDYVNMLTMLGAMAIISITVATALKYVNQIKNDTATGELAEESWDGIGEFKNPVPFGWAIIFYWNYHLDVMVCRLSKNQFSQIGQYNEEVKESNAKFCQRLGKIQTIIPLVAMGESVFLVQCAPCHGVDAEGIEGKAQDLTHRISKEQVLYTIEHGPR